MICYLAGALSPLNSDDVADDGFDDDESAGRDGETGAKGYGGEGRGRIYTYRYTVTTTRMTPGQWWEPF